MHGTPKTHYYWAKLMPLLTEHFTVVAPDLRGFGYTDKPPVEEGYDSLTNANDMAELMTQLGHHEFHLHGEDRGAEFAYVLAATQRDRVKTLSFCEMLLSGEGLEEWSNFTPDNISAQYRQQGVWVWHIPFFWIPHLPEMLIRAASASSGSSGSRPRPGTRPRSPTRRSRNGSPASRRRAACAAVSRPTAPASRTGASTRS